MSKRRSETIQRCGVERVDYEDEKIYGPIFATFVQTEDAKYRIHADYESLAEAMQSLPYDITEWALQDEWSSREGITNEGGRSVHVRI